MKTHRKQISESVKYGLDDDLNIKEEKSFLVSIIDKYVDPMTDELLKKWTGGNPELEKRVDKEAITQLIRNHLISRQSPKQQQHAVYGGDPRKKPRGLGT